MAALVVLLRVRPLGRRAAAFALLVYVGPFAARFLLRQGGRRSRAGRWLAVAAVLVVLGKGADRAPAVLLEEHGIALRPGMRRAATAFEEGRELLHPPRVARSVWVSQAERRYLS